MLVESLCCEKGRKYIFHIDVMFNRMYKTRFDSELSGSIKLWFS